MSPWTAEHAARTLAERAETLLGRERAEALRPALEEAMRALLTLYGDPPGPEEFPAFYSLPPEAEE